MKNKLLNKPKEHDIQDAIIQYLRLRKYYVIRMNSGKMQLQGTKKIRYGKMEVEAPTQRSIDMNEAGTPDLMAFKNGVLKLYKSTNAFPAVGIELLFIEVKRPGNKPTPLQQAKMKEIEEYGAKCIVATSVEDLEAEGI